MVLVGVLLLDGCGVGCVVDGYGVDVLMCGGMMFGLSDECYCVCRRV